MTGMGEFVLDLSEQGLKELDPLLFLERPLLVELDLSNNNLVSLPESISQCSLLKYVNISGNPMMRPPPVLFSIPALRAHPENIIFGSGQTCSRELALMILEDCDKLNQCMLEFTDLEGMNRVVSFPASTTIREFFLLAHPATAFLDEYVLMVRNCRGRTLRFAVNDIPLSLYIIPDAEWSFELALLPPNLPASMWGALAKYVEAQAIFADANDKTFWELRKSVQGFRGDDVQSLIHKLEEHHSMSSRLFRVDLLHCGNKIPVKVMITKDSVALVATRKFYYGFGRQSITFDYVEDSCLLVCDGKALLISNDGLEGLLPMFAMTLVDMEEVTDHRLDSFRDIARVSVGRYESVKDRRFPGMYHEVPVADLDATLDKYRMAAKLFRRKDERRSIKSSTPVRRLTS